MNQINQINPPAVTLHGCQERPSAIPAIRDGRGGGGNLGGKSAESSISSSEATGSNGSIVMSDPESLRLVLDQPADPFPLTAKPLICRTSHSSYPEMI
jgi:hypothetical protein